MKRYKNPFETTIKGIRSSTDVVKVVRRIQNKIFERGIISDGEFEYLRAHTDWDRVNPNRTSTVE